MCNQINVLHAIRSLTSAFAGLTGIIAKLINACTVLIILLVAADEQTCLSQSWSQSSKTGDPTYMYIAASYGLLYANSFQLAKCTKWPQHQNALYPLQFEDTAAEQRNMYAPASFELMNKPAQGRKLTVQRIKM